MWSDWNVLSCEFGRLPSDLTPYSGCAELPIGDAIRRDLRRGDKERTISQGYSAILESNGHFILPDVYSGRLYQATDRQMSPTNAPSTTQRG